MSSTQDTLFFYVHLPVILPVIIFSRYCNDQKEAAFTIKFRSCKTSFDYISHGTSRFQELFDAWCPSCVPVCKPVDTLHNLHASQPKNHLHSSLTTYLPRHTGMWQPSPPPTWHFHPATFSHEMEYKIASHPNSKASLYQNSHGAHKVSLHPAIHNLLTTDSTRHRSTATSSAVKWHKHLWRCRDLNNIRIPTWRRLGIHDVCHRYRERHPHFGYNYG